MDWSRMEWYIIKFHCSNLYQIKKDGIEWNIEEQIPLYTTQSFHLSLPLIYGVSNEMELDSWNIIILPLF